jgi:hypothetical protein
MIGWGTTEQSFARMVDHAALYPITVINDVRQSELDGFASKNLMLCREIADQKIESIARRANIAPERAQRIITLCKEVVTL